MVQATGQAGASGPRDRGAGSPSAAIVVHALELQADGDNAVRTTGLEGILQLNGQQPTGGAKLSRGPCVRAAQGRGALRGACWRPSKQATESQGTRNGHEVPPKEALLLLHGGT